MQYVPTIKNSVRAFLCYVLVRHGPILPISFMIPEGHVNNLTIAPVVMKQPQIIGLHTSPRSTKNDIPMGRCKKYVTPLLKHWSYVFLALTRRYKHDKTKTNSIVYIRYVREYHQITQITMAHATTVNKRAHATKIFGIISTILTIAVAAALLIVSKMSLRLLWWPPTEYTMCINLQMSCPYLCMMFINFCWE